MELLRQSVGELPKVFNTTIISLQKNPVDAKLRMMKFLPKRVVNSLTSTLVHSGALSSVVSILFVLPTFYILNSIFVRPALAQKVTTDTQQFQNALGTYGKEAFDFQSTVGVQATLYTQLVGCPQNPNCPVKVGAVQKVGELIAGMYAIPPASGIYYAFDVAKRLNPVRPAYAQGVGFQVLNPFLELWKAVRNLVYVLFVIGAIILGFSVMFRTKISPQAVMTIQAAIPRLVIGLILVTFSYAIVGFLIDLTYVAFGALVFGMQAGNPSAFNVHVPSGPGDIAQADIKNAAYYFNDYVNANFGATVGNIFTRGISSGWDLISGTISTEWAVSGVALGLGGLLGAVLFLIPGVNVAVAAALIPIAIGLVVAVVFFLFRILFALARAYLMLLIYLILGPLFILWGAISGTGMWTSWLRKVLANLLVFPAIGVLIFLGDLLIRHIQIAGSNAWGPPYLGRNHVVLQGLIGLGIIFVLPQIPDIINQFMGERPPRIEGPQFGRRFAPVGEAAQRRIQRRAELETGMFGEEGFRGRVGRLFRPGPGQSRWRNQL